MNKAELVAAIAAKTGDTKKAAEASVDAFVSAVKEALKKGEKVQLVGFGAFEVRKRAARKGRNPQTKEEIKILIYGIVFLEMAISFLVILSNE